MVRTFRIKTNKHFTKTQNDSLEQKVNRYMESRGFPLFDYQKTGVAWMLKRELSGTPVHGKSEPINTILGGLLCDEPGLGKTIQTCATMYGNPVKKTLIIVPGAVMHQWVDAIQQILPNKRIYKHHGSGRCQTIAELIWEDFDIAITTLGMVYGRKKDPKTILHHYGTWDRIIIDEVHFIRNSSSKTSKMAVELGAKIKWGLTGTPIQNSEKDLITLYKFLGVPTKFQNIPCLDILNKSMLKRRTKTMVEKINASLKLPTLYQTNHALQFLCDKERAMYSKIRKNVSDEYHDILDNESILPNAKMVAFFELLLRLRQASIHPQIVINGFRRKFKANFKNYTNSSAKISKIVDMIEEIKTTSSENILVFCHFREEMDQLDRFLRKKNIGVERYDGSLSMNQREAVIKKFPNIKEQHAMNEVLEKRAMNEDTISIIESFRPRVLLIQINAGGVGLNLQQFTQVFITSPNWNPSNEIQAIARAHRIGQEKPVNVHRFTLYDEKSEFSTIDERICSVQANKRNIMATILDDDTYKETGKITTSSIKSMELITKLNSSDFETLLA